ncbi:hypothetical protein Pla8534_43390 [Lignipirellula cremea]|uniref:Chromosome partition protein Smc n=2 Tax=Lignipirellula cremea TaxID=2528010 RepID=A0A518DXE8_9BACT|nr:hypothetical protein Pla8534_43390 [Lignipirellula cremea]
MQTHKLVLIPIVAALMLTAIGCDEEENKRLAEMAERHLERQAEQSRQVTELQREVAEGSRRLVEADAQARQEMVTLQREVQAERSEVGRQRDLLEGERRDLAAKRRLDPIVAAAITNIGLLLACLLPLVLCWYLLTRRVEPADDQAVAEVLLEDLVADRPLLLPRTDGVRAIGLRAERDVSRSPDDSDHADRST